MCVFTENPSQEGKLKNKEVGDKCVSVCGKKPGTRLFNVVCFSKCLFSIYGRVLVPMI